MIQGLLGRDAGLGQVAALVLAPRRGCSARRFLLTSPWRGEFSLAAAGPALTAAMPATRAARAARRLVRSPAALAAAPAAAAAWRPPAPACCPLANTRQERRLRLLQQWLAAGPAAHEETACRDMVLW